MSRFGDCSERLNYLREEVFGLTQEEVAEQLGMTQSNISSVEIGRVQPSLIMVLSFAIACKISPSWLILNVDDDPDIIIPTIHDGNLNYNPTTILKNSKTLAEEIILFLGKRIKVARESSDISQKKLSEMIKLAQSNISAIERGLTIPSLEVLTNISEALDIHLDWFLAYKMSLNGLLSDYLASDHPLKKLVESQLSSIKKDNNSGGIYGNIDGLMKDLLGRMDKQNITPSDLREISKFLMWLADIVESTINKEEEPIINHIQKYYSRKNSALWGSETKK